MGYILFSVFFVFGMFRLPVSSHGISNKIKWMENCPKYLPCD